MQLLSIEVLINKTTTAKLAEDVKVLLGDVEGLLKVTAAQGRERIEPFHLRLEKKVDDG